MAGWEHLWSLVTRPDNIAVVAFLSLVVACVGVGLWLGWRNDRLRRLHPRQERPSRDRVNVVDVVYPPEEQGRPRRVFTWPHLVRIEFLAALVVTVVLLVWSLLVDAPLEEPANPTWSPNPSKAPWYFVGLQELLVYFDPWIAGVVLPLLAVFGLMLIPYVDVNPRGSGYYTLRERPFALTVFLGAFFALWLLPILIGTFCRGPGWMWYWPWEPWDPYRVVAERNVHWHELWARLLGWPWLETRSGAFVFGGLTLLFYYAVGAAVPYLWLRRRRSPSLERLGPWRYGVVAFFVLTMVGVFVKILLRLSWHVKYVWVTPWFNV